MGRNAKASAAIRSSGQANFIAVVGLTAFALLHPLFGVEISPPWAAMVVLTAALLAYASVTVIIASHDLERYASLLIYEALLRFAAAAVLFVVAFFVGWWGILAVLAGLADIFWGVRYCVWVPQATGRSVHQLLAFDLAPTTGTPGRKSTADETDLAYRV